MIDLLDELRIAFRQWRRQPVVPVTILLTLTLGLGAAIAVFAVTWSVLWRPIDAPQSDQLVWIEGQSRTEARQSSPGAFAAWQANAKTFSSLAAIRPVSGALGDHNGTDRISGALVTDSLFVVVALQPTLGRTFSPADSQPGAPRTLLISSRLWTTRYGSVTTIVGQAVTLNGAAATIIGVLPPAANTIVPEGDWWAPLALDAKDRTNIGPRYLDVIGRLSTGASIASAREELDRIGSTLPLRADDGSALGVTVTPLMQHLTAPYASGLQLLFAGVLGLVLTAAVNAAALLLARADGRRAEMAIRASIGAARTRLVRQLFVESALLVSFACGGAVVAALWLTDLLRAILPADIPRLADARVDLPAALFTLALGGTVAMIAGLVPAMRGARSDLQPVLRAGTTGDHADHRLRAAFVIAQVAMAVVLGCGAALLMRTASALDAAPRGYDARGVLTAAITLPASSYRDTSSIAGAISRILTNLAAVPGVTSASASSQVPFAGGSPGADLALAEESFAEGVDRQVKIRIVAPDYLSTLGIRLKEGRDISLRDSLESLPVVVVNQTLARRLSPSGSVLGRAVKFGVPTFNGDDGRKVWTVVGIADDSWDRGPRRQVEPEVLLPLSQTPAEVFFWISRELQLGVRTTSDAAALAGAVRRAVAGVDPRIPIGATRPLEDRIADAFARERMTARLLTVLGLAGLGIALLGLAATVAHQARRQRRETAIRLALGASFSGVLTPLVATGAMLAAAGALVGIVISLGLGPLIGSLLFAVAPNDARTLGAVAMTVLVVSTATALFIGRAAARVDPAELLRS